MKLVFFIFMLKGHKILKGSYSENKNLQEFASWIVKVTDTTKITFLFLAEMFYGANLECKLYFLKTIIFNDIMEINFIK